MIMETNKIYLGDCLEIMKDIPDNSVDIIITDPPYLMVHGGSDKNSDFSNRTPNKRIEHLIDGFDVDATFNHFMRICKSPNFIIFCSNKQVSMIMKWFENLGLSATLLIWEKTNPIPLANAQYISDIEFVIYIRGDGATFNTDIPYEYKHKICRMPTAKTTDGYYHPTQKPIDLIRRYLLIHSSFNDIVFDPFMGSGTTCVAAIMENRRYIGIEKDEKYFEIAKRRIQQEQSQLKLF